MTEVVLKHLRKVYPLQEEKTKSSKKRERKQAEAPAREQKANLQITGEGVVAVQDLSMEIHDREFIVLVGPSGCGKSTVLRMIAGLEQISEGELYIDGKLMNKALPRERDIAMVFQNYALYPHMTVYDNMAFALKLQRIPVEEAAAMAGAGAKAAAEPLPAAEIALTGAEAAETEAEAAGWENIPPKRSLGKLRPRLRKLPKAEIDARVRKAAEILEISELLKRKPKALSGGQRQRVAIGRAIVREPKLFLMDEPLSNLDAKLRNQMRGEIIKLRQRVDTTFIYVTHDQTEAMTLGDRVVVLRDGYVQQIGSPQQVFSHPANLFVAGFIGFPQMNFFRQAQLQRSGDDYRIFLGERQFSLSPAQSSALAAAGRGSGPVILGLRPEKLFLCPEDHPQMLLAEVEVAELLGSQVQVHAALNGERLVLSLSTQGEDKDFRQVFTPGRKFCFSFSGEDCHLFDPQTEENLLPALD
ncbi:MAG: ATP-binding cassette domain-containing protein [Bacillota bacterium]|nr:ATP-binding cassette domain-containing protein [Bacillota bacterium]